MSGSATCRSTRRAACATRAVSSAAEPRKRSHWRGPSTFSTTAPSTSSGGAGSSRSTIERPLAAVVLLQVRDASVPDQRAVVDHEQPLAQPLDVAEVVRRQDDRDAVLAVDLDQEVADPLLRDDVEADRRLVEEQQLGAVEHRRRQFAADALAERELPDGRVEERVELEHFAEPLETFAVTVGRDAGRCGAGGRRSRGAVGPTTAGCAARTSRRSGARARSAAATARARRRGHGRSSGRGSPSAS